MRFVKSVLEKDKRNLTEVDVFSTHPYVNPSPPELNKKASWGSYSVANSLHSLRENFAEYGQAEIPVWYTEGGWTISPDEGGAYEDKGDNVPLMHHAAYTCRYYATAVRLGVQCVTAMFITDTDGYAGGHFDRQNDFAWRPTAFAVQNMIRLMPHPKLEGIQSDGEGMNYIYEFKRDALDAESQIVIMAYRIEGPQKVEVPVPFENGFVTQMLGKTEPVKSAGGKVSVEIGPYPVYIYGTQILP
ncbi:hypothetical protein P0Y35_04375 [Kiritimatiellaeota bacterium B1221]|nr:hypothetical protein [Kiritimatiellaeota bacterium B1221]